MDGWQRVAHHAAQRHSSSSCSVGGSGVLAAKQVLVEQAHAFVKGETARRMDGVVSSADGGGDVAGGGVMAAG
jgi:hypothetical protein